MYFLLILFFASLFGIILMIGKKLMMVQNGEIVIDKGVVFEIPFIKEVKDLTSRSTHTIINTILVVTIRLYVKITNFFKNKYREMIVRKTEGQIDGEKKEISKFLKIISEYKHKIRRIKHKIKEEEESL